MTWVIIYKLTIISLTKVRKQGGGAGVTIPPPCLLSLHVGGELCRLDGQRHRLLRDVMVHKRGVIIAYGCRGIIQGARRYFLMLRMYVVLSAMLESTYRI